MGNRIYGCDDCQLACPWNKFARRTPLPDFDDRGLHALPLADMLRWNEAEFLRRTEGSAIRRIGHERWLRNVSVAAGNALRYGSSSPVDPAEAVALREALVALQGHPSEWLREHVHWAMRQGDRGTAA
jgi:epoxyqueuosine reductase